MNPAGPPSHRSVETEVLTKLLNYLSATGFIKNFIEYKNTYGKVNPVFFKDNVAYIVDFREGLMVRRALDEIAEGYSEKADKAIIANMKTHWIECVNYLVFQVQEE